MKITKNESAKLLGNGNAYDLHQIAPLVQSMLLRVKPCIAYLFWAFVCITSAQVQAQHAVNMEQVNKAWARFLLCDFSQPEDVDAASWEQTINYINNQTKLFKSQKDGPQSSHFKVDAYGTQFEQINMLFGNVVVWTPEKRGEVLEKNLAKLGLKFADGSYDDSGSNKSMPARLAKKSMPKINVYILDKPLSSWGFNNISGGTTLVCTTESADEQEIVEATGFPSAHALQIRLYKEELEDTLVNQIVQKGGKDIKEVIAGSSTLNKSQVEALFSTSDVVIINALIGNKKLVLSAEQIDTILNNPMQYDRLKLISHHFMQLNPTQISMLNQSDNMQLRDAIAMKQGGEKALNTLNQYFTTNRKDEEIRWLLSFSNLDDVMVDLILSKGSEEVRQRLTSDSNYSYNQSQIERILQDTSSGVQIGLLRRKDVVLTEAQIERGLKLDDRGMVSRYIDRLTKPTHEQLEYGLTHKNPSIRWQWAYEKRFQITEQQALRGLEDGDLKVRSVFLKRPDVTPSDKHLDACTVEPDFSSRYDCIQLASYTLTQWRFERIALDDNPNVLRGYLRAHKKQAKDLEPFFLHALANAPDDVLIQIANSKSLIYTEKMLQRAKSHSSPFVRLYFKNHKSAL